MTARTLSTLLGRFDVRPGKHRTGATTVRGYLRGELTTLLASSRRCSGSTCRVPERIRNTRARKRNRRHNPQPAAIVFRMIRISAGNLWNAIQRWRCLTARLGTPWVPGHPPLS
jgi:hypothetical protein